MFVTYYPNSVYHFDFFFSFYFSLCFITIPAERAIWGINYTYVLTVESFFSLLSLSPILLLFFE